MWKRGDQKNIVAGKIIPKQKLAEKESLRKRVMQEIVVFKYLDHPNVVRMMGDFTTPQSIVILMELCTQQTLHELQRRRGKLTEEETRFFTRHIVEGLKYLRDLQIVHRDIKPANLFLDAHLTVKIGDFGLAIYDSDRRGGVCGTPNYMAPEILEKKPYSFGVDLWALGCTIYGMLCGRPPFDGGVLDKTAKKIRSGEFKLPASMSAPAKNLISDMLKLNPEDRLRIHEVQHTEFFNTGAVKPPRQEIQDASGTRYEVGDYLYDCSFGNIYAMSIDGGPMSLVAKVVNKATLDQDTYERVLQEICVMKRLEHPNVAQFVDSIPEETSMYLLYEPCISYPLSRLMKRRRTLREEEVRYYMGQVVDGLEYLHNEANIVHGNLCTDALCLTENMTVKLCDFGLAAVIEGAKAGESYGEPKYQAPERYEQAGYSYDVDMYALGCTVYELLTGNELDLEFAALSTVSMYAASAIKKLTDSDPKTRMKLKDLPRSRFFRMVHCPDSMPTSSLSSVPEFDATRPPRPLLTHSQTAE
ncbi:hypothetical protein L596_025484 [Steinernema carpocapsae]|uniref:Protein kinase domain-containing protein n=1 Tax=Steinernema carpocapsae TaxID=34508 RepID=A0A4U5M7W9_STECR|nr:hypothetical protein L596_025484 [Steinernema carpocapsae]